MVITLHTYQLVLPCLLGVEGLVAEELRDMGAENVAPENGRVLCAGSPEMIARANIRSRFAERVLVLLGTFEAKSFESLFRGVKALPWTEWIGRDDAFPVKGRCLSSQLMSVPDCQAIIKKAVVESLKEAYKLEHFPETGANYQIQFLIMKDKVSIMLDTSGAGLHKRGYRKNSNEAPIKETLAAVMAKLSRVRTDGTLIDPFCGSGTILIEGAMLAMHIAPGLRRHFAAEKWKAVPGNIWDNERIAAKALERRDEGFLAFGYDIDPEAVRLTLENAKKAGVAQLFVIDQHSFGIVERMEISSQFLKVRDQCQRRQVLSTVCQSRREIRKFAHQSEFGRSSQRRQVFRGHFFDRGDLNAFFLRLGKNRADSGMGVLQIVDRVFVGLAKGQIHIKNKLSVGSAINHEETCSIFSDPVDQVRERDVSAAAFAHLDGLSVFDHLKHLVQHVLGESLRNVEAEVS